MLAYKPIPKDAVHLGKMPDDEIIQVVLSVRRRPGHDPIPDFASYIGCPKRDRLP